MPQNTVALIGLGKMGLPMCGNLIGAGFAVKGADTSEDARRRLADIGGTPVGKAADAVRDADYVITMLPNGAIVRDVLTSPEVLGALKPDAVVIDMSSSEPTGTQELGKHFAASGHPFVDAPVSGGVKGAEQGSLAIMAGGSPEDLEKARPVLEVLGAKILPTGPLGSGHATKALNNYVSSAGLRAASEALIVAQAYGIDANTFIDVLNASSGRNNSTENKMKPFVIAGTYGSGFSMALMSKDIRTADRLARSLDAALPGLADAADFWEEASRSSGDGADHTEIYKAIVAGSNTPEAD
jgi:3-hydroxyisobutyrate dehydrogenase